MAEANIIKLDKGQVLIQEGDNSLSMYWLQEGSMRVFKKKGQGFIELGVVHKGELVGDLSFLDNKPRSASVEALTPCTLVEIPRGNFEAYMQKQPSWMHSLIQTLANRLRAGNNRIRELESASTVYVQQEGQTSKKHEFLSTLDILKLSSTLLLVGSHYGQKQATGAIKTRASWLQMYATNIFSTHLSKITVFMDIMHEMHLIKLDKQKDHVDIYIPNIEMIESFIRWLSDENTKAENKKLQISDKAMAVMHAIYEFGDTTKLGVPDQKPLNMQDIFDKAAAKKNTQMPFEWAAFDEIVKAGLASEVRAASEKEKPTTLNTKEFNRIYTFLSLRERFQQINSQKRGDAEY